MKRILCYGDSNTWGHDPTKTDPATGLYCRYPKDVRWTGVLQNLLGSGYTVIEEGQNGRTIATEDPAEGEKKCSAAILDYGMRGYLVHELTGRGCDVTVYPANTALRRGTLYPELV